MGDTSVPTHILNVDTHAFEFWEEDGISWDAGEGQTLWKSNHNSPQAPPLSYRTRIHKKYTTIIQNYHTGLPQYPVEYKKNTPLWYRTTPLHYHTGLPHRIQKKYRTALQNVKYTTIIQDYPVEYKKYRTALQNKTHHYDTGLPDRIQKYTTMIQDYRTSLLNAGLPYKI